MIKQIAVDTDSHCFDNFIADKRADIGDVDASILRTQAKDLVARCIKELEGAFGIGVVGANGSGLVSSDRNSNPPPIVNGLIYGRVQSGKTNLAMASIALASTSGFRLFVVLTSDNLWLGQQTVRRFRDNLVGGPTIYDWRDFQSDPVAFGKRVGRDIQRSGVVLVCTKNAKHLANLATTLAAARPGRYVGLVVDDEADNASLDTNKARAVRANATGAATVSPSRIFELIREIRDTFPAHVYLQVTATPQSLLLQGLQDPLRPRFAIVATPGTGYVGGDEFFGTPGYTVEVDAQELDDLRAGRVDVGSSVNIPPGLGKAVATFLLGVAFRQVVKQDGRKTIYSMLVHVDHRKDGHRHAIRAVQAIVDRIADAMLGECSRSKAEGVRGVLHEAHGELSKTESELPELTVLERWLVCGVRNIRSQVVDADQPDRVPEYAPGPNFLIGGNRLGRGVTIDGLMVTYYGRDPRTRMMDTVHQHARMFGYRRHLLSTSRLFSAPHILASFKNIHSADTATRESVRSTDGSLTVSPVFLGPALQPTRANVLDPSEIGVIVGPMQIWPHGLGGVETDFAQLESDLGDFADSEEYYEVPIERLLAVTRAIRTASVRGVHWSDERVQQILGGLKRNFGITTGRIQVRRGIGQDQEGFKAKKSGSSSGFISGQQWNEVKVRFPSQPVLLLRRQRGRREDGWGGCPFYAPTLVIPRTDCAFLFVI